MSGIVILVISLAVLVCGYIFYGGWLAKKWGVDPTRKTPAYELEDGVDYCPAKAPVLLGHHFSSIAGAGPINGPIQAAFFGWVPVLLWILIGGIFIGAVQDFSSLFVSVRNKGLSIGSVMEKCMTHKAKLMFSIFTWLVMLLVDAAFADIVANTFNQIGADGVALEGTYNGSVAMASILFIPLAIIFGFAVYRRHANLAVSTVAGVVVLVACVAVGIMFPLTGDWSTIPFWRVFVFVYCAVASVTPVWILLQPRDYLNSFLLYFMIIAAVIGIIAANPSVQLTAFAGFNVNGSFLFPTLFITVACGAVSGFHALISSGTSSKQLSNEKDAKMIGYGGMLIECLLAVVVLITIGSMSADGSYTGSPSTAFANGVSGFFATIGFGEQATDITYTVICLAVSAFCLTSLDTCCRLGRFTLQELMAPKDGSAPTGIRKAIQNKYVSTVVNILCAAALCVAGYSTIWPLFGACNQLIAVPVLMTAATWLKQQGKGHKMFYVPMVFMALASVSQLVISLISYGKALFADFSTWGTNGLLVVIDFLILVLAIATLVEGFGFLFGNRKPKAEKAA